MRQFRVRRSIWFGFTLAACLALVLPLVDLVQTWQLPVTAQVLLTTTMPSVGQPMQLIITFVTPNPALIHTGELAIKTEMITMAMGTAPVTLHTDGTQPRFVAPLLFVMAGTWTVDLHLSLPAHPHWHQQIIVQVQPSTRGTG